MQKIQTVVSAFDITTVFVSWDSFENFFNNGKYHSKFIHFPDYACKLDHSSPYGKVQVIAR